MLISDRTTLKRTPARFCIGYTKDQPVGEVAEYLRRSVFLLAAVVCCKQHFASLSL
jgi:hypothetical protein